ncbi:MAG TPA: hemin uptake protein HemP [Alphaproteobacteria bacterium]|jgi:hemin uptake protein HemP|nr:hemin uptake protein HemP [Alphaproteobacteria bacterium]
MKVSEHVSSSSSYQVAVKDRQVESMVLLGGHKELIILHQDENYRLRITAKGKLILTK